MGETAEGVLMQAEDIYTDAACIGKQAGKAASPGANKIRHKAQGQTRPQGCQLVIVIEALGTRSTNPHQLQAWGGQRATIVLSESRGCHIGVGVEQGTSAIPLRRSRCDATWTPHLWGHGHVCTPPGPGARYFVEVDQMIPAMARDFACMTEALQYNC